MEIDPKKFAAVVAGITSLGLIAFSGYFLFDVFFGGEKPEAPTSVETVNFGLFGPKVQAASKILVGSSKVSFKKKDFAFTESSVYKNLTEPAEVIPMSDSRGRPDPFQPYVAP